MAIRDDILTLKNKEGTLAGNKVCNFAYDDTAFADDTTTGANGVTTYNYNNHNNIPVKDPTVLKTNPTIISKGFRSQVSVLPRMLLNHIFGRVSYNLNKTVDTFNSLLSNLYNYIGQPNGLATLDNTGRLPYSQLPLSAVEYKGAWNASTNTPTLASGTGTFGDEYIVSTQGTQNLGEGSITYQVGDRVIYNGSIWQRIPASSVRTVNLKTPDANGNVTVNAEDIVTPDVYGYDRKNIGKVWRTSGISAFSSKQVSALCYANGVAVAGVSIRTGESGLYWSDDGVNWTSAPEVTSIISRIFYVNGLWLAYGSNTTFTGYDCYSSTDGKNWTNDGALSGAVPDSVCFANGIYVRASYVSSSSSFGLDWSTDGINWTRGTTTHTYSYVPIFTSVFYADGIWVACSDELYWSTDGKVWNVGDAPSLDHSQYQKVYYADGIWVAVASSASFVDYKDGVWVAKGNIYWSENGKNWTHAVDSAVSLSWSEDGKVWNVIQNVSSLNFSVISKGNGIFVASGRTSGIGIWWSSDGKAWTKCTNSNGGAFSNSVGVLCYADTTWLAGVASSYGAYLSIGTQTNNVAQILDWLLFAVDNLLD